MVWRSVLLFLWAGTCAANEPLGILLPPSGKRCLHEFLPKGAQGTVEIFVESGGKLEVHLTLQGPMSTTWDGLPEEGKDTEVLLDEVVSNGAEEDFDDSYLYTFTSKKGGGYSVCILNDMNRLMPKVVTVDFRSSARSGGGLQDPIKLASAPDSQIDSPEDAGSLAKELKDAVGKSDTGQIEQLEKSIRSLKAGLRKVQRQQQQERHRQAVHTAINKDSNSHMVAGSVLETLVFIGTSLFQIIFVRNWFEGKGPKQWA